MNTEANKTNVTEVCLSLPPWYPRAQLLSQNFPFLILQLQFVVVFAVTQFIHRLLFIHFGLPPLISELLAGLLLSSNIFTRVKVLNTARDFVFPKLSENVWNNMATMGLALSFFIIAVKMDFTIIRRSGRKPIAIGLLVLIVPSIVNTVVASLYGHWSKMSLGNDGTLGLQSCAALSSLTALPVIAILLSDLELLNSELGRLALSVGLVTEIGSIVMMILSKGSLGAFAGGETKKSFLLGLLGVSGLLLFVVFILRPWMNQIVKQTPKGRPVKDIYVLIAFTVMLVGALITDLGGEYVMLGCFIVGAAVPEGPPLGSAIVYKFESFISGLLVPFFVTTSAMKADVFNAKYDKNLLYGEVLVTLTALFVKTIICVACGLYYNLSMHDALALAAILSYKGIVDISSYNMFIQSKLILESAFAYMIVVTTVFAFVMPIIIKQLYHPLRKYSGYQKRDIMHSKSRTPLRVLACICRPDNVSAMTNLLSLSSITKENPTDVYVLHLIKLVGRAQPIFISHDLQQKKVSYSSSSSYSEDVMWAFNRFKQANLINGGLSVHLFTMVSPPKAMHEDICTLALDKLASVIILPYHRKLRSDGSIDLDDHGQRALNKSVLDRAPCSVGILIDRGNSRLPMLARPGPHKSVQGQQPDEENGNTMLVGVIFIGGSDDREAVAFAQRMAKGRKVKVLVIRIVALGDGCAGLSMMDSTTLTGIHECSSSNPQFNFMEKVVTEGAETATMLNSIVDDFDLIIVGRRINMDCPQTSGLGEWSEVPELGILGDLLASSDLKCKGSILVIQQQKQWTWKSTA